MNQSEHDITIFKGIEEYPKYEISIEGVVRNKRTGKLLKWTVHPNGYYVVHLSRNDNTRSCPLVHRLVLLTFSDNPQPELDVNHKDGNKANNSFSNLEWTTKSENTRHAHLNGLFKSRSKLTKDQVLEIKERIKQTPRERFDAICLDYGVKPAAIYDISTGKLYGYIT